MDMDSGGQKYVDPDPEHWKKGVPVLISLSIRGTFSTHWPETDLGIILRVLRIEVSVWFS
jgi:hypothetical protein